MSVLLDPVYRAASAPLYPWHFWLLVVGELLRALVGLRRSFAVAAYLAYALRHVDKRAYLIDGVAGDDVLHGGPDDDTLYGGSGSDGGSASYFFIVSSPSPTAEASGRPSRRALRSAGQARRRHRW